MASPSDDFVELPGASDSEDYRTLLEDYSTPYPSNRTAVIHGHVVSVSPKEVIVDIGRKIDGLVPAGQFHHVDGVLSVKPGDLIEVMLDNQDGHLVEGYIPLSYERAHRHQAWE